MMWGCISTNSCLLSLPPFWYGWSSNLTIGFMHFQAITFVHSKTDVEPVEKIPETLKNREKQVTFLNQPQRFISGRIMPRFKPYNTSQNLLLPVNLAEQLVPGSFEYTLNYLVDHEIDTSIFHDHYSNDKTGRLAYDPAMLVKVVLFAYSRGITSSRKIEKACKPLLNIDSGCCWNTLPAWR